VGGLSGTVDGGSGESLFGRFVFVNVVRGHFFGVQFLIDS
jgi:hypothetical protein